METTDYQKRANEIYPSDEAARAKFLELCEAATCGLSPGVICVLAADVLRLDKLKDAYDADIAKRGLGDVAQNGRQKYWRDNKSCGAMLKAMEQQRRLLQALGLIGRIDSQPGDKDADDDGDAFDNF